MPRAVSYNAGSIIFFSGDRDDSIYIVKSGLISCKSVDAETGEQISEKLKPGEFFGVKSVLANAPRFVTAVAAVDSVVIALTAAEFEKMFSTNKEFTEKMLKSFSRTLRDIHQKTESILHNDVLSITQDVGMLMVAKAFYDDDRFHSCVSVLEKLLQEMPEPTNKDKVEKLLEDARKKESLQKSNPEQGAHDARDDDDPSLKQFSAPIFQRFTRDFKKGDVIISEFEPGETFYLIKSGKIQIVKCITGQNKNLDILKKGEFFGEMAIIDKSQRSATCVAETDVSVLEFNKENFSTLVLGNPHLIMNLLRIFCRRIYDQQRKLKIVLIKDLQVRVCDIFLMYDEKSTSVQDTQIMGARRTFNITVRDIAHWAGIPYVSAQEQVDKLAEKNKIEVLDTTINVMNIHDMRRTVDAYYNNL